MSRERNLYNSDLRELSSKLGVTGHVLLHFLRSHGEGTFLTIRLLKEIIRFFKERKIGKWYTLRLGGRKSEMIYHIRLSVRGYLPEDAAGDSSSPFAPLSANLRQTFGLSRYLEQPPEVPIDVEKAYRASLTLSQRSPFFEIKKDLCKGVLGRSGLKLELSIPMAQFRTGPDRVHLIASENGKLVPIDPSRFRIYYVIDGWKGSFERFTFDTPKAIKGHKKKGLVIVQPLDLSSIVQPVKKMHLRIERPYEMLPQAMIAVEHVHEVSPDALFSRVLAKVREPVAQTDESKSVTARPNAGDSAAAIPSVAQPECPICHQRESLLRCSMCKTRWYCGPEHQKMDWPRHKRECKELRAGLVLSPKPSTSQQPTGGTPSTVPPQSDSSTTTATPTTNASKGCHRLVRTADTKTETTATTPAAVVAEVAAATPAAPPADTSAGGSDDEDLDLVELETLIPIACPIGQTRIETPVRGVKCNHARCFDLENFIALAHQSGVWQCPVCLNPVSHDELKMDTAMQATIRGCAEEVIKLRRAKDGSYTAVEPAMVKKEKKPNPSRRKRKKSPVQHSDVVGGMAAAYAACGIELPYLASYIAPHTRPRVNNTGSMGVNGSGSRRNASHSGSVPSYASRLMSNPPVSSTSVNGAGSSAENAIVLD